MVVVACGYLITAAVMAFVFPIGYKGGSGVAEGLRFGAVIGLLWWLPANVVLSGVYETTVASALVDGVWHIVEGQPVGSSWAYCMYDAHGCRGATTDVPLVVRSFRLLLKVA